MNDKYFILDDIKYFIHINNVIKKVVKLEYIIQELT